MRKITKIIVHCTATRAGREVTVAEITLWHKARGFRTIGYHYVVGLDGEVHAGRDESKAGAHCYGRNSCSIGLFMSAVSLRPTVCRPTPVHRLRRQPLNL